MDFPTIGKHFFLHFSETLPVIVFLPSSGKVFFNRSFIPACGNGFSGWWKPFYFVERFFLMVETITKTNRTQFLKEGHILTNEN